MNIPNANPYDVAQVCLNGHLINSQCEDVPQNSKKFCPDCGEKTITACTHCSTSIEGFARHTWLSGYVTPYDLPSYCGHCGLPFPWIASKLDAVRELADMLDEFNDSDRELLSKNLEDLVRDTPRTPVAVLNVKKVLSKTSPHIQSAFKSILLSVINASIKEQIWG